MIRSRAIIVAPSAPRLSSWQVESRFQKESLIPKQKVATLARINRLLPKRDFGKKLSPKTVRLKRKSGEFEVKIRMHLNMYRNSVA